MHNLSNENVEVDGKLDCMWLSPNQKKMYIDFVLTTKELGLD